MKVFKITPNEAGQRLDKYLKKLLPNAQNSFLYKMLRKKNIVLNGKKTEGCIHLRNGDIVTLYLSDETFDKFSPHKVFQLPAVQNRKSMPDLQVLYENADILIINKPSGLLSQKAAPSDISANELIIQYLLEKGSVTQQTLQTFRPAVCSRLDRNTSGILIAGKTLQGLQTVSRQLKDRSIEKYYRCIVTGILEKPQRLNGYLCKDRKNQKAVITCQKSADGRYIETEYKPVRLYDGFTMLEVHLITGRFHQIRAHLASIGHPVIGDVKYGDQKVNRQLYQAIGLKHQLLHACRVVLADGQEVTAPLPETFSFFESYCCHE